jgi:uncharacterized protein YjbI with pentapeptide repeats
MRQPAAWLVTLAVAAVLVLLACVLVFPRLLHPPLSASELQGVASADRRIELQQAQAKLQNDTRTTLLQAIAGLLLVAGAIATWRQVQVSREGQITERFTRAIDQLGGDKDDQVRLGGVYSLERIGKESPADRRTVQAVLAAVVRADAPWRVGAPAGPAHPSPTVGDRLPWLHYRAPVVQAAMIVLGRRPRPRDELQLFLSRVDLRAAFLHHARLNNANLRHSNLARSQMPEVDLVRGDLEDIDLRQTNMRHARLTGANLKQAHLQNADLRGADLRGADLRDAQLEDADLTEAYPPRSGWVVDLVGSHGEDSGPARQPRRTHRALLHLRPPRRPRQTNLRDAWLTGANLKKAHLQKADLRGADLRGADLRGANLQGANLDGADYTGARVDATTVWLDGTTGHAAPP